jgi:ABC-type polysaccharide/polyol phosphate export permease
MFMKISSYAKWRQILKMGWVMGQRGFAVLGAGQSLGRLWPTIGLAIRITFVGIIFSLVFERRTVDYVPWLATGWAVWALISSSITSAANVFSSSKGLMLSLPIPKEAFLVKVVVTQLLLLIQNMALVLFVVVVSGVPVNISFLLCVPGVLLTSMFLIGVGFFFAPLVARYKDLGPLISSIVGVMFFTLPIMWKLEDIKSDLVQLVLGLNPLYHYLQIVRLPLLSEVPTDMNYLLATVGAFLALIVGTAVMNHTRDKIVYWA